MDKSASPEKISHFEQKEKAEGSRESPKKIEGQDRVKEAATEAVATPESREGTEVGAEFSEGKVAEGMPEDKKSGPAGQFPVRTADEVEMIRARLLQNLPSRDVMVDEIIQTLRQQEKAVVKLAKKARKKGIRGAHDLNQAYSRWRQIKEYLAGLADATFEVLKQLWLKIVHGV